MDRRDLYNGFGDTLARAIEFVAAPVLFAFVGSFLDGRLGTAPLFLVGLLILGMVGTFLRTWYGYVEAIKAEEAKAPWNRH